MINKARGEILFKLDGVEYRVVPDFKALCNIEARTGESFFKLASKLGEQKISVTDIVAIIYSGMEGHNDELPKFEEIGDKLMKMGLANALGLAVQFMTEAVNTDGEKTSSGKAKGLKQ
jgi:hypothetical protein